MKPNNQALFIGAFFSSQFLKNIEIFVYVYLVLMGV
nr:MAG TPA: hypothetical protein [Caudoviricetes sp.]